MSDPRPARGRPRSSPEAPRRVRSGIKLPARDGVFAGTPLVERWLGLLEEIFDAATREEGLQYARWGQTRALEPRPGELWGQVQGRAAKPYETRVLLGVHSEDEWGRVVEAMADEAVYLVKLMAHELPPGVDDLLATRGLTLLPRCGGDLQVTCTCAERQPCKHAAALGYLLAARLSDDPLEVFHLRGVPVDRLVERLRQARAVRARGMAAAHVDPMIPETQADARPLEESLDDFWRCPPTFDGVRTAAPPHHVSHALLRRLGPSPLKGRFPLVGLLASVYDRVASYAVELRDRVEPWETGHDDGGGRDEPG